MAFLWLNFAVNTVWAVPLFISGEPSTAGWMPSMMARMKELERENALLNIPLKNPIMLNFSAGC
jgi:hypothetical protein